MDTSSSYCVHLHLFTAPSLSSFIPSPFHCPFLLLPFFFSLPSPPSTLFSPPSPYFSPPLHFFSLSSPPPPPLLPRNMPDVEALMQEWPPQFEETLKQVQYNRQSSAPELTHRLLLTSLRLACLVLTWTVILLSMWTSSVVSGSSSSSHTALLRPYPSCLQSLPPFFTPSCLSPCFSHRSMSLCLPPPSPHPLRPPPLLPHSSTGHPSPQQ